MAARDRTEAHRTSTPLELLFDLCFVVAIAQAGSELHHGLAAGHVFDAVRGYLLVFFAIWWAWMNFTWFASAYDCDDVPYRLAVFAQMAGALIIAAGVPRAFERQAFGVVTFGYAVLRLALIALWLRAARSEQDAARRSTALRYAFGVAVVQVGWLALLFVPAESWLYGWCVLAPAEMLVPAWAERARTTTWHPHHIAERYGLLTLIVLGESVLAATVAIQHAIDSSHFSAHLLSVIAGGLCILFSMWWVYFDRPVHGMLVDNRVAFRWGYGHFAIFVSTAAVGAGLAVAAEHASGDEHVSALMAGASVAVPVALYLVGVWQLCLKPLGCSRRVSAAIVTAALTSLASMATERAVVLTGVCTAVVVAVMVADKARHPTASAAH
jgi:low temperature requirement protein LtrA